LCEGLEDHSTFADLETIATEIADWLGPLSSQFVLCEQARAWARFGRDSDAEQALQRVWSRGANPLHLRCRAARSLWKVADQTTHAEIEKFFRGGQEPNSTSSPPLVITEQLLKLDRAVLARNAPEASNAAHAIGVLRPGLVTLIKSGAKTDSPSHLARWYPY
jgi:hypothetical protein